jgi:hypothetical protein
MRVRDYRAKLHRDDDHGGLAGRWCGRRVAGVWLVDVSEVYGKVYLVKTERFQRW